MTAAVITIAIVAFWLFLEYTHHQEQKKANQQRKNRCRSRRP